MYNSRQSHRLGEWVLEKYGADANVAITEAMMRAFFEKGENIHNTDVLLKAAANISTIDIVAARKMLENATIAPTPEDIDKADAWAKSPDINCHGVPFFIINDKFATSGAQDSERLIQLFERACSSGSL
eukprot:g3288.t1